MHNNSTSNFEEGISLRPARIALEIDNLADVAHEFHSLPIIGTDKHECKEIAEESELRSLITNSWPVITSGLIGMIFSMICLIAVGHVDAEELAGAGFGIMFCNMTGYSIVIGIASGLETVASQLYGAGHHLLLGIALQKSIFVASAFAVLILFLWFFSGLILPIFIDEELARISGSFASSVCPGIPDSM